MENRLSVLEGIGKGRASRLYVYLHTHMYSETLDFSQRLSEGSGDFPTLFSRAQFFYLVQS